MNSIFDNKRIVQIAEKFDLIDFADVNIYQNFLIQTFYYVRHSTKLLGLAISRFGWTEDNFRIRYEKHIGEEQHHERLVVADLKQLAAPDQINWIELPATRPLYQCQYFNVDYLDPICLLGYIIFLEGLAVHKGPDLYKTVSAKLGKNACSFLQIHALEDPDHFTKANEILQRAPLNKVMLVRESFDQTAYLYENFLDAIYKFSQIKKNLWHSDQIELTFQPNQGSPLC